MRISEQLARIRVILKDTTHPGNIGSVTRAMKTMGLSTLHLVAPRTLVDATTQAMAAGATDIIEQIQINATLAESISDCTHVFAFTARRRDRCPPYQLPREAAALALRHVNQGGNVALLFGGERSGLENTDIQQATTVVEIPTNPDYTSLNLSQAVQIAAYEIRLATTVQPSAIINANPSRAMPTREEFEALMTHLKVALHAVGLPKANDKRPLLPHLRRLLDRAEPDQSEVRLLRGVCKAIEQSNSSTLS